jgi:hypothetical protein
MKHKFFASCLVLFGFLFFISSSLANDAYPYTVCTRDENGRVNLRTGPGTEFEVGLVDVGSGGLAVIRHFEQRNFTISHREKFTVYSTAENEHGEQWYKVGTNQWIAWIRSDFVCLFDE